MTRSASRLWPVLVVVCCVDGGGHVVTVLVVTPCVVSVVLITVFHAWFKRSPLPCLLNASGRDSTSMVSLIMRLCLCSVAASNLYIQIII